MKSLTIRMVPAYVGNTMCTLLVKVPFYLLHIFVTSQMIAKHSSAVRQVHFSKRKSVHTTKIQIIKTT